MRDSAPFGCLLAVLALVGGLLAMTAAFSLRDPDGLLLPNLLRILGA